MVYAENLSKKFGDFQAVHKVNLAVPAGIIYGFLGANGAGKSTTIRMLCGLLSSSSGFAKVAGFDIDTETEDVKRQIGYMSQKFSLYPALTVQENLEFFGGLYGLSWKRLEMAIPKIIREIHLEGSEKKIVQDLPGGIRQRIALAAAILHEPKVLFLDEPTAGVDPLLRRTFWKIIGNLSERGTTVFVTTHYMDEVEQCHSIALMAKGEIIDQGPLEEVRKRAFPEEAFQIPINDPGKAFKTLRNVKFEGEYSIHGASIHLFPKSGEHSILIDSMTEILDQNGIGHGRPEKIFPGMDDVFMKVVRNRELRGQQYEPR